MLEASGSGNYTILPSFDTANHHRILNTRHENPPFFIATVVFNMYLTDIIVYFVKHVDLDENDPVQGKSAVGDFIDSWSK